MWSTMNDRLRPEFTKTSSMYPTELGIGSFESSCCPETEIFTIKSPLSMPESLKVK